MTLHTGAEASFLLSQVACPGGSLVPCCEDTQAAYKEAHLNEELCSPANSPVSEPSWKWMLQVKIKLQMTTSLPTS